MAPYLVLNWTQEKSRKLELKKLLSVRIHTVDSEFHDYFGYTWQSIFLSVRLVADIISIKP